MNKILEKKMLAEKVWYYRVQAPLIAKRRKAGQFIILRVWEGGERIPLTIADADPIEGSITLIVQDVGKTTNMLADLNVGDSILDLAGPLGKATHVEKFGTVVMVGGGIGIAPAHPIAQAMNAAGNKVISIIGARNKDLLIMEEEMRKASDEVIIMTDDGSHGRKGFVTNALKDLIDGGEKVDLVVAIGPPVMMKFVSQLTKPYGIHTVVSLNTIMIDGTGMCGGCRITYNGENRFVCVDGPEFDGHLVDFDNMMARQAAYRQYEEESRIDWEESGHKILSSGCRLNEHLKRVEKA
jgi:ferredoxin--NADP+ reductase